LGTFPHLFFTAVGTRHFNIRILGSAALAAEFVAISVLGSAVSALPLRRFRRGTARSTGRSGTVLRLDIPLFGLHLALSFPFFMVRRMAAIYLAKIRSRALYAERTTRS
jgi:hypothetical protein